MQLVKVATLRTKPRQCGGGGGPRQRFRLQRGGATRRRSEKTSTSESFFARWHDEENVGDVTGAG
ncbi:hypothetical protein K0M31_003693 [Melipona bicolor]|uniref:Uncharacterized protein n=1 Tax=Melipona bicolor TaxID=60889 RepID=A0AA40FY32_9HYME|nr:hypothetical protein K0M31_003693 [Melipona bicolor]